MKFDTWAQMMRELPGLDEEALRTLINFEVSTQRRRNFLRRMHQRYAQLRTKRERDQLIAGEILL